MHKRILFSLLYLFLTIPLAAQVLVLDPITDEAKDFRSWEKNQRWELYQDLDGGFEILLPAPWEHRVDTVSTDIGPLAYHTYFLNVTVDTADNVFYMLSYVDYPEGSVHEDSTELVNELLEASQEEALERMSGELLFSTEKEIDFHAGRYWRIDYLDGNASVRTQAFVAGRRYYAIQTISRTRKGINKSTDKFFGSLRVY